MFMSFKMTWIYLRFLGLPPYYNKIAWFCGNQFGKSGGIIYHYVLRFFGVHPVPEKNYLYFECENGHTYTRPAPWPGYHHFKMQDGYCFRRGSGALDTSEVVKFPMNLECSCGAKLKIHQRLSSTYRFCSENLPMDKEGSGIESSEIRNRTYPELKKWLPPYLIKRDISQRSPSMRISDPNAGCTFGNEQNAIFYPGKDIVVEFLSYSQEVQSGAGQQRISVFCDEESPYAFYEEQPPRLMAENGDFLLGLTPANRMSYTFDEFYEEGELFVRSKTIADYYKEQGEEAKAKRVDRTSKKSKIAIFQAATDDNPVLSKKVIDGMLNYKDDDTVATRRYGIHRQVKGRIFKNFDWKTHFIKGEDYFTGGLPPLFWTHFRGIDVHPRTPYACGTCTLSPRDELFIWYAEPISPEKYTVYQIMRQFISETSQYRFKIGLCDPEAKTIKVNLVSIYDELNRVTSELKREGVGQGGYWEPWNTKGEFGRDKIKERLQNSRRVGRPFNNEILEEGRKKYLPTLWILDTAREAAEAMQKWSWEDFADQTSLTTKDAKNTPQQKWSHFNMVWEAILKHTGFRFTDYGRAMERDMGNQYMKSRRA